MVKDSSILKNEFCVKGIDALNKVDIVEEKNYCNSTHLKIVYMFMLADGKCSDKELKRFDEICKNWNVWDSLKEETIEFGNNIVDFEDIDDSEDNEDNSKIINKAIRDLIKEENYCDLKDIEFNENEVKDNALLYWILVNLAYSDYEVTDAEKRVIEYVAKILKIDKKLIKEIDDDIETILMLTQQIEWTKDASLSYDDKTNRITDYQNEIEFLLRSIKSAIYEINY